MEKKVPQCSGRSREKFSLQNFVVSPYHFILLKALWKLKIETDVGCFGGLYSGDEDMHCVNATSW